MKKLISIILAMTMVISTVCFSSFTAFADTDCGCCEDCTEDDDCECYCDYCSYCFDLGDDGDDDGDDNGDDGDDDGDETEDGSSEENATIDEGEDPEEVDTVYTESDMKTDLTHMRANQFCGDSLLWYINGKTLVIFGNGRMNDYSPLSPAPWKDTEIDKIIFRNGVEYIGKYAFSNTKLNSIEFASTIVEIGDYAFDGCSELTKVHLNKGLEKVGRSAFADCISLKDFTFNNTLIELGDDCFTNCTSLNYIRFPKTLQCIPNYAFSYCIALKKVVLREGLLSIGDKAFYRCDQIDKIQTPKSLVKIGNNCFGYCRNLSEINLSDSGATIGEYAFYNCNALKELNLGRTVAIGDNAFSDSGITRVTVTGKLTNIGNGIFDNCPKVTVDVINNAKAYKFFKKLNNVNVVCRVHCNHSSTTKKATFFSDGKIDGSVCEACGYETAIKTIYQIKNINLSKTSGVFNGKSQIPTITVKDRANKTISPTNYNVTFSKDFRNVGKHTVVVQFKNNYSGKRTLTYKINPDKTTISSLKATSKGFAVTLKKQTKQTTGYQIQYSKTKRFATHKTFTIGKTSTTKKAVSKLAAKKKYYVRVRTYKTIGKTQFSSPWSPVKSVVTK